MVYVLDIDGQPLMPTTRHEKVRRLLNNPLEWRKAYLTERRAC